MQHNVPVQMFPLPARVEFAVPAKQKILEGSASMRVNYALEPEEVEKGYVLTCQAVPTSAKITVSFDE